MVSYKVEGILTVSHKQEVVVSAWASEYLWC